jgi:hypothetical protein
LNAAAFGVSSDRLSPELKAWMQIKKAPFNLGDVGDIQWDGLAAWVALSIMKGELNGTQRQGVSTNGSSVVEGGGVAGDGGAPQR